MFSRTYSRYFGCSLVLLLAWMGHELKKFSPSLLPVLWDMYVICQAKGTPNRRRRTVQNFSPPATVELFKNINTILIGQSPSMMAYKIHIYYTNIIKYHWLQIKSPGLKSESQQNKLFSALSWIYAIKRPEDSLMETHWKGQDHSSKGPALCGCAENVMSWYTWRQAFK